MLVFVLLKDIVVNSFLQDYNFVRKRWLYSIIPISQVLLKGKCMEF